MDKPTDTTTGLDQLGARQYDPSTGRFISVDSLVAATGQPYTYGNDNPITNSDPNGTMPQDPGSGGSCPQTVCGNGSNTNGPPPTTSDNPNAPGSATPPTGTQGTYGGNGSWGEQRIDNNTAPQHHSGGILHAVGAFGIGFADEVYGAANDLTGGALGPNLGNNYCDQSSVGGGNAPAACDAGAATGGILTGLAIIRGAVSDVLGGDTLDPVPDPGLPGRAVYWVPENASMSADAALYQSGAAGSRVGLAPTLDYTNAAGNPASVRFDGFDGYQLIDRKLAVVTTPKAFTQAGNQSLALSQNGLTAVWEVPTAGQAARADSMFEKLGITNISTQVVPYP